MSEHLKAPHGGRIGQNTLQGWLSSAVRSGAISAGDVHLVVFILEMDALHTVVVLTTREDQTTAVGYTVLVKQGEYWNVNDVFLDDAFRGGAGAELYRYLVSIGYKLRSGEILSDAAEAIWLKLGNTGRARTINIDTGEVEEFNDKPAQDKSLTPKWRWIAEAQYAPEWDRRPIWEAEPQLQSWLDGRIDESTCHIRWPGLENDCGR